MFDLDVRKITISELSSGKNLLFSRKSEGFLVNVLEYVAAPIYSIVVGWPLDCTYANIATGIEMPMEFIEFLDSDDVLKEIWAEFKSEGVNPKKLPQDIFPATSERYAKFWSKELFLDFSRHRVFHICKSSESLGIFLEWLDISIKELNEFFVIKHPEGREFNCAFDLNIESQLSIDKQKSDFLKLFASSSKKNIMGQDGRPIVLNDPTDAENIFRWMNGFYEYLSNQDASFPSPDPAWNLSRAVPLTFPRWAYVRPSYLPMAASPSPFWLASKEVANIFALIMSLRAKIICEWGAPWFSRNLDALIDDLDNLFACAPPDVCLDIRPVDSLKKYRNDLRRKFRSLNPNNWRGIYSLR
ncbi:hypothetical protein YS110_16055 [Acidovorax sp. YS12]|nr:hypothetical protein YS110_16055 [Acidovorax sp. YS12]